MRICIVGPAEQPLQHRLLAGALARRGYDPVMTPGARWAGLWRALARADAELYYADSAHSPALLLALFCLLRDRRLALRAALPPAPGLRGAHALLAGGAAEQQALARLGLRSRVAGPLFERAPAAPARDIDVLWSSPMRGPSRPDRALSLARRLPRARVHLACAPLAGDEALFREVRRMAADIANASFHSAPPRAEALALLGRARLLVATSEEEHLPYAWQEAWANGVPVAALSDPEGLIAREGLGVVADTPVGLFDAVGALLEDPAALQAAAERCRRYMARAHSEARTVRSYLAAFEAARRRGAALPREHPA